MKNLFQKAVNIRVNEKSPEQRLSSSCVSNTSIQSNQNKISCKYCNLHFASKIWLNKHILRNHADSTNHRTSNVVVKIPEERNVSQTIKKVNILNYKQEVLNQQSTVIRKTLAEQQIKTNKGKKKISPTKSILREQLKIQLEAQRKLLQVQQEIFEKANKAQNEIYELLSKLGDDDEGEANPETDEEIGNLEPLANTNPIHLIKEEKNELYMRNAKIEMKNQGIISESILSHEEFIVTDNYEIADPLLVDDSNYVLLNQENTESIVQPEDQNVVVVVRSDEGEEEYELVEIVEDQMYDSNVINDNNEFNLEIVGTDTDGVHCRIVADTQETEDMEINDFKAGKTPVKVDVGKIPMISQTNMKKQKLDAEKTNRKAENENVLNKTINKSQKLSNEYIQKIVQNAAQTEDNKFECPICHELVSNRYSLGPHILRLHSKQKSKVCPHCDRAFTCTGDLTRYSLIRGIDYIIVYD